jgi:DNA-binding response OmpR family regulator
MSTHSLTKAFILVVEDDDNLRLALTDNLADEGYSVTAVRDGAGMKTVLASGDPLDLIILDIMLPDTDGYTLASAYRAAAGAAMILMLTARTLEEDLVKGFDAGADDYLAKPYRLRELLARVTALLRRQRGAGNSATESDSVTFADITIDLASRSVTVSEGLVEMTRTEYDLLLYFWRRRGEALTRDAILDGVWGEDVIVDHRTVDNFISSLKRKLHWSVAKPYRISTIRGVGYRFEVDE